MTYTTAAAWTAANDQTDPTTLSASDLTSAIQLVFQLGQLEYGAINLVPCRRLRALVAEGQSRNVSVPGTIDASLLTQVSTDLTYNKRWLWARINA